MIDLRTLIGAAVGAAIAFTPAYFLGRSHGADSVAHVALQASVKADNDRRQIDAEIASRAAADLCRSFGLRAEAVAECVRRLEQTHGPSGNGSHDHRD